MTGNNKNRNRVFIKSISAALFLIGLLSFFILTQLKYVDIYNRVIGMSGGKATFFTESFYNGVMNKAKLSAVLFSIFSIILFLLSKPISRWLVDFLLDIKLFYEDFKAWVRTLKSS